MNLLLATLAALGYLVASPPLSQRVGAGVRTMLVPAALLFHGAAIVQQVLSNGALSLGITEAASVFAWQAAVLLWLFCLRHPVQVLGSVLYPLAALAALLAALVPTSVTTIPLVQWKIQMHVVLSLLSAGFLTLAAVQAVMLALQDRLLHRHPPASLAGTLPPLQTMEKILFQLIAMGFFTLSLALVTGLLFVDDLLAQHLAHKTVLSLLAWLVFGVLLWGRWQRGWRGRTATRWALSGYAVLSLAYFGSKLVLEQILGRHWS
jgi:ABC-type uncharacterized transport system permease subunit